jgi:mRNA interferase HigB
MKLANLAEVERFAARDRLARRALQTWVTAVRYAEWKHFAGLKKTFRSADKVGRFVVFNVGGNKYRVIAVVDFAFQQVHVKAVLDHSQYDRGRWRDT